MWYCHKDRHIEQYNKTKNSRNTISHRWSNDFWQDCQDKSMEKRTAFSINGTENTDYMQKNEVESLYYTAYKTLPQMG